MKLSFLVTWKTVTKDIMPGMNVTLKCSTLLENVCDGGGRKWKGGKNNTLLVFNEGPVNKKKYSSKCENNGFTLTIIDFRLDDFNQNYTCSYKFDQYTDILRQDSYACKYRTYDKHTIMVSRYLMFNYIFWYRIFN